MFCQKFSTDASVRQREMEVENKMKHENCFSRQTGKEKTGSVSQKMAERPGEFDENNVGSRRTPVRVCSERKPKTKNSKIIVATTPLFQHCN
jgi:hypothetical protein